MRIQKPVLVSVICILLIGVFGIVFYYISTHDLFAPTEATDYMVSTIAPSVYDTTDSEETSPLTEETAATSDSVKESDRTDVIPSETDIPSETIKTKESKASETKKSTESSVVTTKVPEETTELVPMEYSNAKAFEDTLNEGENLVGAVVHFTVDEVKPDSAFGYNIWAGEHLNFVSSSNPNVSVGDKLTVKVTGISRTMGSWIIDYKMIDCNGKGDVSAPTETTIIETTSSETEPTATKEYMSASELEADLNAGVNVTGSIVHFTADEVHPDSLYGYNIWAGEHLNFCSTLDPHVTEGTSLTVKITGVENSFGSWIISYKML